MLISLLLSFTARQANSSRCYNKVCLIFTFTGLFGIFILYFFLIFSSILFWKQKTWNMFSKLCQNTVQRKLFTCCTFTSHYIFKHIQTERASIKFFSDKFKTFLYPFQNTYQMLPHLTCIIKKNFSTWMYLFHFLIKYGQENV